MSLFTDASLVLVPSGIKNQKVYSIVPTDGSGDLTFSRASNATRVNSSGLVEKVRTNQLLQSNSFDTTWTTTRLNVTSGQSDPDGGTTAWKISNNTTTASSFSYINQGVTGRTFSIYAKAGELTQMLMYVGNNRGVYFDLTDGSFVGWYSVTTNINYSSTSVGGGWYRYVLTLTDTDIVAAEIYTADAGAIVYSLVSGEGLYIWRSQMELGDIATDYIATTTSAVSTGPVSGLPRLDYSGGASCPSLLLEPQRTNSLTYSEQFDNVAWDKANATISANAATSPDGLLNADKLQEDATNNTHAFGSSTVSATIGQAVTFSVFLKKDERNFAALRLYDGTSSLFAWFNLNTGAVGTVTAGVNASIVGYPNNWYRCSITITMASSSLTLPFVFASNADGVNTYNGTVGYGIFAYGAQQEVGAYATSYIPTLSSAVTRVADSASKTGIASLIGQSEGTIYWEGSRPEGANETSAVSLSDGSTNNEVIFRFTAPDTVEFYLRSGGGQTVATTYTGADLNQNTKIAFAYKANDVAIYVNGTVVVLDTSATVPTSLTSLKFSRGNDGTPMIASVNQALVFKTRLSNADLATLTTL